MAQDSAFINRGSQLGYVPRGQLNFTCGWRSDITGCIAVSIDVVFTHLFHRAFSTELRVIGIGHGMLHHQASFFLATMIKIQSHSALNANDRHSRYQEQGENSFKPITHSADSKPYCL